MSDLEVRILGDPSGALNAFVHVKDAARDFSHEIEGVSSEVVGRLSEMAAGVFTLEKAFEALHEGITKADEIRDLSLSLGVFTGSISAAREAMEFFEKNTRNARDTTEAIAGTFRNELPLAMSRGFSQESMQHIALWLSQFSTVSHQTLGEVEAGWQQLLSGSIRNPAKNPILSFMGITKADIATLNWDEVVTKLQEIASHFPEFGQSFASAMQSAKQEMLEAFGKGFNEAMGEDGRKAVGGLLGALTSPDALEALRNTGKFIGKILSGEIIDALVAIHFDDWLERESNPKNWFHRKDSPLIPKDGQLYDKGHYDMFGQWQAPENPAPGTEGPNTYVRQQGAAALQSLGITHAPQGFDYTAYADTLGVALTQHRDKSKEILAMVKDEIHGNTVVWTDLTSSIQEATKAAEKVKIQIPHGLVKDGKDNAAKQLAADIEIAKKAIENAAKTSVLGFDAEKSYAALAIESPFDRKQAEAEIEHKKKLVELMKEQQIAEMEISKLAGQSDIESKKKVKEAQDVVAAVEQRRDIENASFTSLRGLAADDFWSKYWRTAAEETRSAGEAVAEFAEKAQDKLATMVPAAAAAARASLAQLKTDVEGSIALLGAVQAAIGMVPGLGGFAPDNPDVALMFKDLRGGVTKQTGIDEAQIIRTADHLNKDAEMSAHRIALEFDKAFTTGADMFTNLFTNGGRDFGRLAASEMGALAGDAVRNGLDGILKQFSGAQQGKDNLWRIPGSTQGFLTQDEALRHSPLGLKFAAGQAGVADAAGGYQAGLSGQPGARTGAAFSGALAGAGLGFEIGGGATAGVAAIPAAIVGAVAGLVVGAVASYIGTQQRQADYQFGIPLIDNTGVAHFTQTKNYTDAAIKQIEAQTQAAYDQIHDSIVGLLLKFPNEAIPKFDTILGAFQPNPSGHYAEHLQQWLTDTLPRGELSKVGDELSGGFQQLGMSADAFHNIFERLSKLDPKVAIGLLTQLADALDGLMGPNSKMHAATHFMDPWSGQNNSFMYLFNDAASRERMSPGALLAEGDAQIVKLANSIKSLSPESQIAALTQLNQLTQQRYATERQLVQELFNLEKQGLDQFRAAHDQLTLQGLTKPDGTPDYYGQAQFYKSRADTDLAMMQQSKNATELHEWQQKFITDVMSGEQSLIQSGVSQKDAAAWANEALNKGEGIFTKAIVDIGQTMNDTTDVLNKQVDPALLTFTGKLDTTNVVVGNFGTAVGAAGTELHNIIEPIRGVGDEMHSLRQDIVDLGATIGNVISFINKSSGSSFVAVTQASRASRAQG
jgi:hypothetical protein